MQLISERCRSFFWRWTSSRSLWWSRWWSPGHSTPSQPRKFKYRILHISSLKCFRLQLSRPALNKVCEWVYFEHYYVQVLTFHLKIKLTRSRLFKFKQQIDVNISNAPIQIKKLTYRIPQNHPPLFNINLLIIWIEL